jgi:hypothetical protein
VDDLPEIRQPGTTGEFYSSTSGGKFEAADELYAVLYSTKIVH